MQRQRLEHRPQRMALLPRDLPDGQLRREAAQRREHRPHARGHQRQQHGGELLSRIFCKLPLQPQIDLLRRERGLHVQRHDGLRGIVGHVTAQRQNQRPADAEMREKHLAQLVKDLLFAHPGAHAHVLEREPLKQLRPLFANRQPDERAPKRRNAVAVLFGEGIAVAGGAGRGVADAAGGDDDGFGAQLPALREADGEALPLTAHLRDGGIELHLHAGVRHAAVKRARHVAGVVADGEDAPAALNLGRRAEHFKERDDVLLAELAHSGAQEPRVARHLAHERLHIGGIRHVAAALAGDIDLLAQLFVLLQQQHLRARPGGLQGSHHARRAAADDEYVRRGLFRHRPCIHPRFLPSA